jgi:hypothetical protein
MPKDRSPLGEFEVRGEWWLPENPANRVPGVLHYKAGDWVRVTLDKFLREPRVDTAPWTPRPVHELLGVGLDGTALTVVEGVDVAGQQVLARHLLIGGHFDRAWDVGFHSAELGLTHLEEWTEHSPFPFPIAPMGEGEHKGSRKVDILYDKKKLLDLEVASRGCRIEIWSGTDITFNVARSVTIKHRGLLFVEPSTPQSFSWFRALLVDLARLFSFFVGTRVYRTKTVCFTPMAGEGGDQCAVEVYDQQGVPETSVEMHPAQIPLPFTSVHPVAPEVFNRWFSSVGELAPVHQLLVETLPPSDAGLETVLLRLTQALEVFHRRWVRDTYVSQEEWKGYYDEVVKALPGTIPAALGDRLRSQIWRANEYSLKNVLKRLIEGLDLPAQQALGIGNAEEFADVTARTRNTLTHVTEPDRPVLSTARQYLDTNRRLRGILYGVLAKSLGFESAAVVRCVQNVLAYR